MNSSSDLTSWALRSDHRGARRRSFTLAVALVHGGIDADHHVGGDLAVIRVLRGRLQPACVDDAGFRFRVRALHDDRAAWFGLGLDAFEHLATHFVGRQRLHDRRDLAFGRDEVLDLGTRCLQGRPAIRAQRHRDLVTGIQAHAFHDVPVLTVLAVAGHEQGEVLGRRQRGPAANFFGNSVQLRHILAPSLLMPVSRAPATRRREDSPTAGRKTYWSTHRKKYVSLL